DLLVFALRPVADVRPLDGDQPLGDRAADDALAEEAVEDRREQGQHVDAMRRRTGHGGDVRLPSITRPRAAARPEPAPATAGLAGSRRPGRASRPPARARRAWAWSP